MAPHLPEEVMQLIFSFLQPRLEPPYWQGCSHEIALLHRTLAAVCRASKTCHRLATVFLYNTIQIYSEPRYSAAAPDISGFESNSALLLGSLLERRSDDLTAADVSRPLIGSAVKHIAIEWLELLPPDATEKCKTDMQSFLEAGGKRPYLGDTWLPAGVDGMPEDLHQDLDWQVCDAAEKAKLRDEIVWHIGDACATGVEDAEVAMILMLCRDGVETLDLTAVPGIRHSLIMDVVEELLDAFQRNSEQGSKPPFRNLRQLSVRGEEAPRGYGSYHFGDLAPFLRLPSLKTLRCHGMQCVVKHNPSRLYPSLYRIELDYTTLSPDGLEDILCSCPNLTELEVSVECPDEDEIDVEEMGQRLQNSGVNLERLVMNVYGVGYSTLPALSQLTKLRHLGATCTMLLGFPDENDALASDERSGSHDELTNILPVSLEVLEILEDEYFDRTWNASKDDLQLVKLLSATAFTKLREVRVHTREEIFPSAEYLEPIGWIKEVENGVLILTKAFSGGRSRCDSALDVKMEAQKSALEVETS